MAENISAGTDAVLLFFYIDHYRYLRDETGFSAAERSANKKGIAVIASYVEEAARVKIRWECGVQFIQGNFLHIPSDDMHFMFVEYLCRSYHASLNTNFAALTGKATNHAEGRRCCGMCRGYLPGQMQALCLASLQKLFNAAMDFLTPAVQDFTWL